MQRTVIVSDLHLGMGRLPETGRYHRLESFFFDREFGDFVDWLIAECKQEPARLVLAGDIIDFLRIDAAPGRSGQFTRVEPYGHHHKRGLGFTEEATVWKTRRVVDAHYPFFFALARWIGAGHEIIWLPGNHDPEVRLAPVQNVLRETVRDALGGDGTRVEAALRFLPWFFREGDRLWVEHGNQSDPENAFAYPLAEELPDLECRCYADELDMPIGSWFQRYVYNGLGQIAFQVPAVSAHRPYAFWLFINRPHALWRLVRSHVPLWRRLITQPCPADHDPATDRVRLSHASQLEGLAEATSLPRTVLEDLCQPCARAKRPGTIVAELVHRIARAVALFGLGLGAVALLLSLALVSAINAPWNSMVRALVLFLLVLFSVSAIFGGGVTIWLRGIRSDPTRQQRAREYAARVAEATGVRIVVLGHYHSEDRWPLPGGSVYINSGTWVPVWDPGRQLREKVQLTFCDLRDQEPMLRYWDPQAGRPRRVILMEE